MTITPAPAAVPAADQSVLNAFAQLVADKTPYVYGGVTALGADCSGAVKWAFQKAGFTFGARTSSQQATLGANVPLAGADGLANATPGEVLLFNEPGEAPLGHEALYAGNGMDYEESHTGTNARLIPVDTAHLAEIRQFITPTGTAGAGINGTAVNVPGTATAAAAPTASLTSFWGDITNPVGTAAKSVTAIAVELLAVAAGLGLVVLGVSKTASPG